MRLKPLNQQIMVITGASSGIGLVTARQAARQGAAVVLAARNEDALRQLAEEIRGQGGRAAYVNADVGVEDDVRRIAGTAMQAFGGFDTWVNNSGVSIYGKCMEVSIEDMRKVIETNLWGVIYGSRVAIEHLRTRGGALINVGSVVSDRAVPLQGIYSASKHAIKGWTDALRMELEHEGAPVSITLIKPGAIDTPYTEHAKNYLPDEPQHAPPVYAPEAVAEAILHAATNSVRDLYVGAGAKFMASMGEWSPTLADKYMEKTILPGTHSGKPASHMDALHEAGEGLRERGRYPGMVQKTSLYTQATMHPVWSAAAALGAGFAIASLLRGRSQRHMDERELAAGTVGTLS